MRCFSSVSLQVFQNFLELIRIYHIVISPQLLQKSLKSPWNFKNIFQTLLQSHFKMSQEFSQNFWKIISQFFAKTPTNARFFWISSRLVYCTHFWTLFQCLLSQNHFENFSKFFQKFIRFLRHFSTFAVSQKLVSHFLPIFL